MGNKNTKTGVAYADYKSKIRALDLIVFAGDDAVSGLIKIIERRGLSRGVDLPALTPDEADEVARVSRLNLREVIKRRLDGADDASPKRQQIWSHVGIAVTSELLAHPAIREGKVYVLESTMSGKLGSGIKNIDNTWALGVQIRCLDDLLEAYDEGSRSAVGVASLLNNPLDGPRHSEIIEDFRNFYASANNTSYDSNCLSLISAAFPPLRPLRKCISAVHPPHWMFCSELVATVNIALGIYGPKVKPENVIPMDLLGFDADDIRDGGVPAVYGSPVQLLSSKWLK